jgi:4-amino-4-deoxy-L-arabinose transferase-like glycosyltransferase
MISSRLYWLALIAILGFGVWLRLSNLDVVEFKRDEANLSQLALNMVRGEGVHLLGIISSVGIPNSPVSAYILALPYAFSSSPVVATAFIGLLNLLALLLIALMARRYYGNAVSLIAVLIYAVSPWAVIYSRKIWAQDMLPPFIIATVWLAVLALVEHKRWAGILCLPLLALTIQIHYSAILVIAPVICLMALYRRAIPRSFWLGILPAILCFLPFVIGLAQANLFDPIRIQEVLANRPTGLAETAESIINVSAIQYAALTISGTDVHSLTGPQVFREYLAGLPDLYPLFNLINVILAAGVIWLFIRSWRSTDQRRSVDIVLLSLVLVPVVVFSVNWTVPYPHYFILIMPAAFTIVAISLVDLFGWMTKWNRLQPAYLVSGTLLAVAILSGQVLYWERLVETLNSRYTPDGFGVPLGRLMDIRQAVLDQAPEQVIAQVGGMTIGVDDGPSIWNFLLADIEPVRFVDERTQVLASTGTALLLSDSCPNGSEGLTYPLREPAEGCYRLTDYPWQVVTIPSKVQTLSNGVQILKATWDSVSGCMEIDWAIFQPTSQNYFFKVHLIGSDGNRAAIADGPAWPGQFWLPGDTVQSQYCVPANTDISSIVSAEIGMYTYDGVTFGNVDVLDSAGNPTGQSIHVAFQ